MGGSLEGRSRANLGGRKSGNLRVRLALKIETSRGPYLLEVGLIFSSISANGVLEGGEYLDPNLRVPGGGRCRCRVGWDTIWYAP